MKQLIYYTKCGQQEGGLNLYMIGNKLQQQNFKTNPTKSDTPVPLRN